MTVKREKSKVQKTIRNIIIIILVIALTAVTVCLFPLSGKKNVNIWSSGQVFDILKIQTIEKTRDEFKILMLTDTQLWTDFTDNKECYEEMDKLVEQTSPDLIVLPGDNLSALNSRFSLLNYIKHMESYGILWANTFGNHDSEISVNSRNWQGDKFASAENCLFEKGPSNLYGCGNYVINIVENGSPVYSLYFFDNGEYMKYNDENGDTYTQEAYMGYEQIAWYEWNVKGVNASAGFTVPSMTFSHFAQPEFKEAIQKYGVQDENGYYQIPEQYGTGYCKILPCTAPVKSGFVDKCRELGSTKYIFCGHDHENNAGITADGITYKYGLKTGPSPAPWNDADETGGTLITISGSGQNQQVETEDIVITQVKTDDTVITQEKK